MLKVKLFSNKDKLNIFLIFLILASATSIISKLTSIYEKDISFMLTVNNQYENKIIYNQSKDTVMLRLRGYGFNLMKYYFKTPELIIHTNKLKESKNMFFWTNEYNFNDIKLNFDSSVQLLSINQDSILFYYDRYMSKMQPIKSNVKIKYSPGFNSFSDYKITPDSILVIGPTESLKKIKFIETELVELENINSDVSVKVGLKGFKSKDIFLDKDNVDYLLKVEKYTEESVKIPVNILNKEKKIKFNYYPKELLIKYFISVDNYKKLDVNDFRVDCVYEKDDLKDFLIAEITKKPSFIKNVRLDTDKIQIIIVE